MERVNKKLNYSIDTQCNALAFFHGRGAGAVLHEWAAR
jgi:hypothetical protein